MKTCPVCDSDYPDKHSTCPTDGAVLIESNELAAGSLVRGKYRIVRKIGQGGMGIVYLADNILLGIRIALKFLVGDLGKDPKFIKRFRMEARAAYQLRHPNIVEVTNLDQAEGGDLFIAMEFIEGPTLRAVIEKARGGMTVPRALHIVRGVTSGLAAAHAQGTVHRDVKPENILIARGSDGQELPKVLDFGIVAMAEGVTRLSATHGLLLTPGYASPEQWTGMPADEIDGRTDIYALGCVFYEMLTGRTPFQAPNTAGWMKLHLEEIPRAPSLSRPELANWQGLDDLVLRLLAKDRNDRPDDFELLASLDAVQPAPARTRPQTIVEDKPIRQETVFEDIKIPVKTVPKKPDVKPPVPGPLPPKPAKGGFPKWAWGALALLALIATFAAGRLFVPQPQPPSPEPQPVKPTPVQPAPDTPHNQNPPGPADNQQPQLPKDKKPGTPDSFKVPLSPKPASSVEQQAVALYKEKRYTEANPLLGQACNSGSPEACKDLGNSFHDGTGVAKDDFRAFTLYDKACNAGYSPGCNNLGAMYHSGFGTAKNDTQAAVLYAKSCDGGFAPSCTNLGVMYANGDGVAKDDSRAAALYAKACNVNDSAGCSNLGNVYANGRGVAKDQVKAAALYSKACTDGNAAACSNLGNSYRYGHGVPMNAVRAKMFLAKGCGMGNQWGCDRLKEMR